jgi:hypothetical protein
MNRRLLACLLLMAGAAVSFGQTNDQSALLCNLPREKAPVVRGISLGMTADQVRARLPEFPADYQAGLERAQKFPDFGAMGLSISPRETGKGQPFEGIEGFYFRFFDAHVVSYSVSYKGANTNPRGPTWPHPDDFIARFTEVYHLPASANWGVTGVYRLLRCKGFEVRTSASDNAYVVVSEPESTWVAEQKKRREAFEEQLRRDFKP